MARLNEAGMSLVEALVALALLGIAAAAMMPAFVNQLDTNTRNGQRSAAISAVEMELENLRLQDPEAMPSSGSTSPQLVVVGDHGFAIVTHFCERSELCAQNSRYVRVEARLDGRTMHEIETVFTKLR